MKHMILVSCVAKKLSVPAPACALYQSQWFKAARTWAQTRPGAVWMILSAEHGLVSPGRVLLPYEKTLNTMSSAERGAWAVKVGLRLANHLERGDQVTILAGSKYREHLVPMLQEYGIQVNVPMAGLGIGQQLAWLKNNL